MTSQTKPNQITFDCHRPRDNQQKKKNYQKS